MVYKAIKEIGGYSIGDEVPEGKAKVWLEMFAVPHVELVKSRSIKLDEIDKAKKVDIKTGPFSKKRLKKN